MTLQYLHGVETIEVDDGIRPIQTVRSAVIGLIGTAPDADGDKFPINEPVLISGNPRAALDLGTDGTLYDALRCIFKIARCTVIVVRIEEGLNIGATLGNVIGNAVNMTGLHAFRKARTKFGFGPRLLIAPGYTTQEPTDGVASVTIGTGGTGYSADTTLTFTGGGGTGAKGRPVINASGQIVSVSITNPGVGYTSAPTVTLANVGGGSSATLTAVLGTVANPVAAEISAIAPQLRAYGFASSPGTSYANAIAYRNRFSTDRLMIIEGMPKVYDDLLGDYVTMPAEPFAAAMQAWVDENKGFWHSFSNYPIQGILGVSRPIEWSFYSSTVEGQLLNSQQVSVLVQDEGFRFMGVRSAISTGMWQFMPVRRTADMVYESIESAMREAIDKPISVGLFDWIEGSVNAYLRRLQRRGAIVGGRCWLDRTLNTPADLVGGNATFDFDIEPPAPLERLTFRAHRNPDYYEELVAQFLRQAA